MGIYVSSFYLLMEKSEIKIKKKGTSDAQMMMNE